MLGVLGRLFGRGNSNPRRAVGRDVRFDLDELARRMGMDINKLNAFTPAYHEFHIPKKKAGTRRILAPSPETKHLQRLILRRMLGRLRAHPGAVGFERGHSIATNALHHVGRAVVVRLDLKDFFASTTSQRVERYFRAIGWDSGSATRLVALTTHELGLPQGAPTSPRLSNLVNYQMDTRLSGLARKFGGVYTRYADDLTFSFDDESSRPVNNIIVATKDIVAQFGYQLHTKKKVSIRRRHQQQRVTGLVVNGGVNLPRETRRKLRAIEHRLRTRGRATLSESQLAGWRALQHMIRLQVGNV